MLVTDVLNLVANLSIGLDVPTEDDQQIFLRYLNLAHFKLFGHTAPVNPFIPIHSDILDVNNGVVDNLTAPIFSFRIVYRTDTNKPLIESSYDEIISKDPGLTIIGQPSYWYFANNSINVWPLWTQAQGIGARYNVSSDLFEINDDLSPIYPLQFHPLLVDGTCYYLFQTESGFKNEVKMTLAKSEWKKGMTDLYNYFRTLGGKKIYSTFSKV